MPDTAHAARYDLPWKIALTHAFRDFAAFFFPQLSCKIDWSKRPRFRDKELAGISLDLTRRLFTHRWSRKRIQGREEGRKQGTVAVLERQLERRFGPLSKAARKKLAKASPIDLEAWSEALLEAQSLKQVLG